MQLELKKILRTNSGRLSFSFIHYWDTHTPYETRLPARSIKDVILNLLKPLRMFKSIKGGERIDIVATRRIIDAILDGSLKDVEYETLPVFNLAIPKSVPGVETGILNPRNIWSDPAEWDAGALELGRKFQANFEAFADTDETAALIAAGPQI